MRAFVLAIVVGLAACGTSTTPQPEAGPPQPCGSYPTCDSCITAGCGWCNGGTSGFGAAQNPRGCLDRSDGTCGVSGEDLVNGYGAYPMTCVAAAECGVCAYEDGTACEALQPSLHTSCYCGTGGQQPGTASTCVQANPPSGREWCCP